MISRLVAPFGAPEMASGRAQGIGSVPVVAHWELRRSHCTICDCLYNDRLHVFESRPVLDGVDDSLPTLFILPGGDLSNQGAFGFRKIHDSRAFLSGIRSLGCATINFHYYQKSRADLLLFAVDAASVKLIETRRYLNTALWPSISLGHDAKINRPVYTGTFGYIEQDNSTVILLDHAKFIELPEINVLDTEHKRCAEEQQRLANEEWRQKEIEAGRIVEVTIGCQTFWVDHNRRVICAVGSGVEWPIHASAFDGSGKFIDPMPWAETPFSPEVIFQRGDQADEAFAAAGIDLHTEVETGTDEIIPTGRVAFFYDKSAGEPEPVEIIQKAN
jgi:hypothetical protein